MIDWTAIWLSVYLATATTTVPLVLGIPIACWIVHSPRRWKFLVETVVALPLSVRRLVTGIVLSFAHTLGEFGVALMVGGDLPGATRAVSISICDAAQSFDYQAASRTSLLLLIQSLVILAATYSLQRTVWLRPRP